MKFLIACTLTAWLIFECSARAQIPIPAPPGKCWVYSPTYCYLNASASGCSGAEGTDPECDYVGQSCQEVAVTDNETYQELIGTASAQPTSGFLYRKRGRYIVCGHLSTCRLSAAGVRADGTTIFRCTTLDPVSVPWLKEEPDLWGDCSPQGGTPTVGSGGSAG